MLKTDNKIFEERREIFLNKLKGKAAIIPGANLVKHHADCEYPFRQDSNFWYLTGFDEPDAIALFLSHKPKGERFILFVAPKDVISEVWHGFRWGLEGAEKEFKADKAHSINEISKMMIDENMPLAYHHHMGTIIETEEDTSRLIENTKDTVKLLVDTGHMLFAQGNSIKLVENFYERIIHVHCKDIRKDILEKSLRNDATFRQAFLDGAFTVPGDGCIDYIPFLNVLKKKNYSGWLVVEAEQDPAKANPFEYAKIGFNYLSKTAKQCGFKIIN